VGALVACNASSGDSVVGPRQEADPALPAPPPGETAECVGVQDCAPGAACRAGRCEVAPPVADAGAPPASEPACGENESAKCALGHACATGQDCLSGECGTLGPNKGKCVSAKSCIGTPGADQACNGTDDCCASIPVPGGAFTNYDNSGQPSGAVVSRFKLDKFEITVGRVRAFFRAMNGDVRGHAPAPGAAEHPLIAGSGWRDTWNVRLPGSWAEINARLGAECAVGGDNAKWGAATWTPEPGPNENKPINCIDWYTLFAFCAWDGGRLPTDAEWSYVAMSGADQRTYPWGNDEPSFATHKDVVATSFAPPGATYGRYTEGPELRQIDDGPLHIALVGKKTGRSKWGHADMGGNVIEFVLDMARPIPATCNNCADVGFPDPPQGAPVQPLRWQPLDANGNPPPGGTGDDFAEERAVQDGKRLARGGSWQGEYEGHWLPNVKNRHWYPLWRTYSALGGRCARNE